MSLTPDELRQLEVACRRLPATTVQDEEMEVAGSPILILMSTVLSLNRRKTRGHIVNKELFP